MTPTMRVCSRIAAMPIDNPEVALRVAKKMAQAAIQAERNEVR